MNGILFLVVICVIYYILYKYVPYLVIDYFYYFIGFICIYIVIYYLLVFESDFSNKIFANIYHTSKQPLYTFNAQQSNSELFYEQNPNYNIKNHLLNQQHQRCYKCDNFLMKDEGLLTYKIPLQYGGQNNINNLVLVCPTCFQFI